MTVFFGAVGPRRMVYFAICMVLVVSLYLALDKRLLLTRLNQLSIEVERRIQWWNWQDTPEEISCRAAHNPVISKDPIPNIVHFILLAGEEKEVDMSYAHFLAIKAAVVRMNAAEIKVHTYGLNTANQWWKEIEKHVTLVHVDRNEVQAAPGLSVSSMALAHQADLLRLAILAREGGIYMDTDVYTFKPFTDLLNNPRDAVMAHEGGNRYGLCNAVIMARPGSTFISKWQDSYKTFNPQVWNEHSVRKPKKLQIQFPDLVCPLSPTVFFWPTWAKAHVLYMHEPITPDEAASLRANMTAFGGAMYENQLAFHAVAAHDYLSTLSPKVIQERDTRFNILVSCHDSVRTFARVGQGRDGPGSTTPHHILQTLTT
ncbi:hypothetical protein FH972_024321 [Carpinus fangiana]|uniref:Alpha 1,4-glycosyltransferase domain-containing protein n=1 Tax=Carpinus fangiana TaxID=176857 RepID=A0A5N6KY13_9ROSI|nr:hypothetical protein FH972_024321 [Carpinus fangiana]